MQDSAHAIVLAWCCALNAVIVSSPQCSVAEEGKEQAEDGHKESQAHEKGEHVPPAANVHVALPAQAQAEASMAQAASARLLAPCALHPAAMQSSTSMTQVIQKRRQQPLQVDGLQRTGPCTCLAPPAAAAVGAKARHAAADVLGTCI